MMYNTQKYWVFVSETESVSDMTKYTQNQHYIRTIFKTKHTLRSSLTKSHAKKRSATDDSVCSILYDMAKTGGL
jgi:hypothetical protein